MVWRNFIIGTLFIVKFTLQRSGASFVKTQPVPYTLTLTRAVSLGRKVRGNSVLPDLGIAVFKARKP